MTSIDEVVRGDGTAQNEPARYDVLVVIVNYRSAELTIDCLRSLEPELVHHPETHVVVVENASGPDQAERLRAEIDVRGWRPWVTLQVATENGGFAAGNNVAIRWALDLSQTPSLIWLLNPDTVVRPEGMAALINFMRQNPDVGLAGSRLEDPDGTRQNSTFRFPSALGELEEGLRFGPASRLLRRRRIVWQVGDQSQPVDWVAGASLMIRREVFEQVGLLDERFFMYYEEVDFCRRARAKGWTCWYVPESRVVHLVGQSSNVTSRAGARKRRPRYWFDARKHYFLTHHGRVGSFVVNSIYLAAFASYRFRRRLQRKPDGDPQFMLWDLFRYNFLSVKR